MQASMESSAFPAAQVQIVNQVEIPLSQLAQDTGELQIFHQHPVLKKFLPAGDKLAFSWVTLNQGKELVARESPLASAMIICQGQARLIGDIDKLVAAGDTVLIPPHCGYSIKEVASPGLKALLIAFVKTQLTAATKSHAKKMNDYALTYEGLVAHNTALLQKVLKNPYFNLLRGNVLANPSARQKFLDSIQVFSDFFQHLLFIRQATCHDPAFHTLFLQHLHEELGHDELLALRKTKHSSHDPVLHATSMWFCNQMMILDNLEKTALVHLVLEVSGTYYHQMAKEKLTRAVDSDYYEIHAEVDDIHAQMGANLLSHHHADVYRRLHNVIYKGWSMLDTMTRRVAQLVEQTLPGETQ